MGNYDDIFEIMMRDARIYMDIKNRELLEKWCNGIGYKRPIGYSHDLSERKITIYAEQPGVLIGKGGICVDMLKEMLNRQFNCTNYKVEFVEIKGKIVNIQSNAEE